MRRKTISSSTPAEPAPDDNRSAVLETALRLLTRREHTRLELQHKLARRAFAAELIEQVLDELTRDDLLSDARFAELYTSQRADKGYGPLRIAAELRERGVDPQLADQALAVLDDFWPENLVRLARKRFDWRPGVQVAVGERAGKPVFFAIAALP